MWVTAGEKKHLKNTTNIKACNGVLSKRPLTNNYKPGLKMWIWVDTCGLSFYFVGIKVLFYNILGIFEHVLTLLKI